MAIRAGYAAALDALPEPRPLSSSPPIPVEAVLAGKWPRKFDPAGTIEIRANINGTGIDSDAEILARMVFLPGTPLIPIDLGSGNQIWLSPPQLPGGANFRFSNDPGSGEFFG